MEPYRQLAIENRARLLALAMQTLSLNLANDHINTIITRRVPFNIGRAKLDPEMDKRAMAWCNLTYIPAWFKLPRVAPRGSPPLDEDLIGHALGASSNVNTRQLAPQSIEGLADICFYDMVIYNHTTVVYMGAVRTDNPNGVPRLYGPCHRIIIHNIDGVAWISPIPSRFNAFPADAIHQYNPLIKTDNLHISWGTLMPMPFTNAQKTPSWMIIATFPPTMIIGLLPWSPFANAHRIPRKRRLIIILAAFQVVEDKRLVLKNVMV
jgi:hypothetical protein